MKQSSFRGYGGALGSRKVYEFNSFGGVDLSSRKFDIDNYRAIDMKNYLYKDNGSYLRKRNGYKELSQEVINYRYRYDGEETYESLNYYDDNEVVHNVWKYVAEDDKEHYVMQKGNKLYSVDLNENLTTIRAIPLKIENASDIVIPRYPNKPFKAFISHKRLWVLTGYKYTVIDLVGGRLMLRYVRDSEYIEIPTTSVGITQNHSLTTVAPMQLDAVNLLTRWRYNFLISGVPFEDGYVLTNNIRYMLDSPCIWETTTEETKLRDISKVTLSIDTYNKTDKVNPTKTKIYKGVMLGNKISEENALTVMPALAVGGATSTVPDNGLGGSLGALTNKCVFIEEYYPSSDINLGGRPTTYEDEKGIRYVINYSHRDGAYESKLPIIGYIEDDGDTEKNAMLILYNEIDNPYGMDSNMELKYPCYDEKQESKIDKCLFGIMFGNNNATNRLFVSGNEEHRNADWHTNEVTYHSEHNYPTYFPDTSEQRYGLETNKVVGYDIVSTDRLLVLKDYSETEKSIYFRVPKLEMLTDNLGKASLGVNNEVLYSEQYAVEQGNNSVAGVRHDLVTNLNGDTLFISNENNLMGLDLQGIVGDNARYGNTRSYYIDKYLQEHDLSSLKLWSNNKELYLMLEDKIFATSRSLKSESNQHEWFILDIKNVKSIIEVKGKKIYFTGEGKILQETPKEYIDGKRNLYQNVVLNIGVNTLEIDSAYYESLDFANKCYKMRIKANEVFGRKIAIISNGNEYISYNSTLNKHQMPLNNDEISIALHKGKRLYANLDRDFVEVVFSDCELINNREYYTITRKDTNEPILRQYYGAELIVDLGYEDLDFYGLERTPYGNSLSFGYLGDKLNGFATFNRVGTKTKLVAIEIVEESSVEAFIITKPYTFGTLEYNKTIWQFTLTNDTNEPSEIELTITNNNIPFESSKTLVQLSDGAMTFDFSKLRFDRIDFEKNITPRTYTYQRILSNVKYICLGIKSYTSSDSIVSTMSLMYSISLPSMR